MVLVSPRRRRRSSCGTLLPPGVNSPGRSRRGAPLAKEYCHHGAEQRAEFGLDVAADGVQTCRGCGLPTRESVEQRRAEFLATSRAAGPMDPISLIVVGVLIGAGGGGLGIAVDLEAIGFAAAAVGSIVVLIGVVAQGVRLGMQWSRYDTEK